MLTLLLFLIPGVCFGIEPDVSGFAEARGHFFRYDGDTYFMATELIRPDLRVRLTDRLLLSATIEAGLTQHRTLDMNHAATGAMTTVSDRYIELERLFMDAYLPFADLRIGRQAVNWGSAFFINPTDPFPELLLTEPWRARSGINAARATVRFGAGHQIQALLGMDDDFKSWLAASRTTFRMGPADLAVSGTWHEETQRGMAGIDLRGNFHIGYWFEGGLHINDDHIREEIAVGADYSFPVMDNLIITLQYYRNNTLSFMTNDYEAADSGNGYGASSGATVTPGRDFGIFSAALTVNPEISCSILWIQSLQHSNGLMVPVLTITPGRRWTLNAAAQIRTGDIPSMPNRNNGIPGVPIPRNTFIVWVQLSF